MPNFEKQTQSTAKSKYCYRCDVVSGFDVLLMHPDSTNFFPLVAKSKARTILEAPMGWCNAQQFLLTECLTRFHGKIMSLHYSHWHLYLAK